jgi:hypothetical protein
MVRVAFGKLVDELAQTNAFSGILAISNWKEKLGPHEVTVSEVSWSASPDDVSYQRHGSVDGTASTKHGNVRFADFEGAVDDLGNKAQIAVYRVTLPSRGLDPDKWVGRPPPPAPADLYTGPRSDGLLSTDEISGNYCCCCFPLGFGATTVMPHGPDVIEQWGWCWFTTLCLGGEVRVRNPGTNSFRHWKDPNNVTTFTPGGASNGPSCLCKTGSRAPLAFQLVDTKDIEGSWCCCCWMHTIAWSCFRKTALDKDKLNHSGCAWILLLPLLPFNEVRTRLYVNGHPTNGFYGPDPNNIDWYRDGGCVGNGPSCSTKC